MKTQTLAVLCSVLALLVCRPSFGDPKPEPEEQWRTAFFKRGFLGVYKAEWAGGVDSTTRSRIRIPFDGRKMRVTVSSMRNEDVALSKLTLAPGAVDAGTLGGAPVPVTFGGTASVALAPKQADVVSDEVEVAVKSGVWFLQQSYSSPQYAYAYSVDGYFLEAGDKHEAPTLAKHNPGNWPGNVYRVEVLTKDTRPTVLCYGDSITHGFSSTPNSGQSYPEILEKLLQLPTLNLGVNGDLVTYSGGVPSLVRSCADVGSVVMLMGINDIISGKITSPDEYSKVASNVVAALKRDGKKVYWGTILPSGGYAAFDKDPAKETLRQSINTWIKSESKADAVIDFATAVADPENPSRMRADFQSDWLHPNDAGYRKLAEAAAAVLKAGK